MKLKRAVFAAIALGISTTVFASDVAKIVIGSAPGAGMDSITRAIAEPLGVEMNRTFVVENRPGASATIAAEYVAKMPADGTTALIVYNAHPVSRSLFSNLAFDPVQSFSAVGTIASTPYILVAHPQVPGNNLNEMIDRVREENRALTFGSAGLGTPQHLMLERFKQQTGLDIDMVHYKSSTQAQTDVIGGHVDLTLSTVAFASEQIKAGRLTALAVTSQERMPDFPDTPTIIETGYEGFVTDGWYAMLLPANAPQAEVDAYNTALNKVLAMPATTKVFDGMGLTAWPGTPESLETLIQDDAQMWADVIQDLGIQPQ